MDILNKLSPSGMDGFVRLTPKLEFSTECPECGNGAAAQEWKVTGLWTVAQFKCESCNCAFLFDLPYSLGVVIPCYLDIDKGSAKARFSGQWYADLTASAWRQKRDSKSRITVERRDHDTNVCLVNCLYPWWGDAVSLLLRVNQLKKSGMGIIVLINPALRWLVPDYVGGIWVVDQGVGSNSTWNEALDAEIKNIVRLQGLCLYLPRTFQPAYLTSEELHAACKIEPFPRHQWNKRLKETPTVTFMSRMDRTWTDTKPLPMVPDRVQKGMRRLFPKVANTQFQKRAVRVQTANIIVLATELRKVFANLEFAVCGVGKEGVLPAWIKDLRVDAIDEETNRIWAVQGAQSQVVCGVTGSHLTIPGSLAGSYIELVPADFLRNVLTCAPVTSREPREAIYSHRLLPAGTDPSYLAELIASIMLNFGYVGVAFRDEYYSPLNREALCAVRNMLEERRSSIAPVSQEFANRFAN